MIMKIRIGSVSGTVVKEKQKVELQYNASSDLEDKMEAAVKAGTIILLLK